MRRSLGWCLCLTLALTACEASQCADAPAGDTRQAFLERHNALAATHRGRSWTRPLAEGVVPGEAASAYQHAWEAAPRDRISASSASLTRWTGTIRGGDPRVAAGPRPADCPLTVATLPEGLQTLDAAACQLLVDVDGPLGDLQEGSLRSDARSPLAVWSAWTFESPGRMRSRQVFVDLAKLLWLKGFLDAHQAGTVDPYVTALLSGLRLGADLRNGADLGPVVVGDLIRQLAIDQLRALIEHVELDLVQLSTVRDGLLHVLAHPDPWPAAIEANILHLSTGLLVDVPGVERLPAEDLATPEAHLRFSPYSGPRDATTALERLWPAWDVLRTALASGDSFAARLPRYAEYQSGTADTEGLVTIEEVHLYKYDLYRSATETSLCMVLVEVGAQLAQADRGAPPDRLDDLDADILRACARDPLSGAPFVLERDGDELVLRSPLRDDPLFAQLPEGARRFVPDLYGRLESRWRAPRPVAPTGEQDAGTDAAERPLESADP